jgi:hypothetical protein
MNGFELCEKILAIDINVKVCFMSCEAEINKKQGVREIYRMRLGCLIRKPVSIDYLVKIWLKGSVRIGLSICVEQMDKNQPPI